MSIYGAGYIDTASMYALRLTLPMRFDTIGINTVLGSWALLSLPRKCQNSITDSEICEAQTDTFVHNEAL